MTLMVISGTQVTFHQGLATSYCSGDLNVMELPTLPYIINSLWPSDAIWWCRSGSPFAQIMACCLMAPSHYLNQCWLTINKICSHSFQGNVYLYTRSYFYYPVASAWLFLMGIVMKLIKCIFNFYVYAPPAQAMVTFSMSQGPKSHWK